MAVNLEEENRVLRVKNTELKRLLCQVRNELKIEEIYVNEQLWQELNRIENCPKLPGLERA